MKADVFAFFKKIKDSSLIAPWAEQIKNRYPGLWLRVKAILLRTRPAAKQPKLFVDSMSESDAYVQNFLGRVEAWRQFYQRAGKDI